MTNISGTSSNFSHLPNLLLLSNKTFIKSWLYSNSMRIEFYSKQRKDEIMNDKVGLLIGTSRNQTNALVSTVTSD